MPWTVSTWGATKDVLKLFYLEAQIHVMLLWQRPTFLQLKDYGG